MPVGRKSVSEAVLAGIAEANKRFERMSHGYWICDYGVEGYVHGVIASFLRKEQNESESMLFEVSFKEIREYSDAPRRPGRPRDILKDTHRADIVMFDRSRRPVHVIEVKRFWSSKSCFNDIKRILALLDEYSRAKNGSLNHGVFVFPIVEMASSKNEAREKVRKRAQKIRHAVKTRFSLDKRSVIFKCFVDSLRFYPDVYEFKHELAFAGCCMSFAKSVGRG